MNQAVPLPRKTSQYIGLIGLGLGLGVGGTFYEDQMRIVLLLALFGCAIGAHMIFTAAEKALSNRISQGCGLVGFGLGLGMGGTFPDGTEWVTWLLCLFWCAVGITLVRRRTA